MLSSARSRIAGMSVGRARSTVAPWWRKLVAVSLAILGLAVFAAAQYGIGTLITGGSLVLVIVIAVGICIIYTVVTRPFWGYAIWFFATCYLTLFESMLPAMFSFDLNMLGLLTLVLLVRTMAARDSMGKLSIEEVLLILLYVYEYVIRYRFDWTHIVFELRHLFVSPLAFYFVAKSVITSKKHLYWLMVVMIATGVSWSLMGIYEQVVDRMWLAGLLGGTRGLYGGIRSVGPAGNYYLYGDMLILTILLCLHLLGWTRKFGARLLIIAACLTAGVGLYYGYSRAPYIAICLSMIVMVFLSKRRAVYAASLAALLCAAAVMLPLIRSSRVLTERFTAPVEQRIATNATSVRMFKANWLFGVGEGNYRESVPTYVERGHTVYASKISGLKNDYSHAHNEYFLKACELGIIGLVLQFGMQLLFLRRFLKVRAKLPSKGIVSSDLASLAFAFMIGVHFTMLTDQVEPFLYGIIFAVYAMIRKAELYAAEEGTAAGDAIVLPSQRQLSAQGV